MAHYLLYVPGASGNCDNFLRTIGMETLVEKSGWEWFDVIENGPDGGRGVLGRRANTLDPENNPLMRIDTNVQQWVPVPPIPATETKGGAIWYGHEPERPVRPADLAWPKQYGGREVLLADNNKWTIPVSMHMPTEIGHDPETGELIRFYTDEFVNFCKMSEGFALLLLEAQAGIDALMEEFPGRDPGELQVQFTLKDSWEYCCTALSINYCIAEPLIGKGLLNLMTNEHMARVVEATLQFPDILDVVKKNGNASPLSIQLGSNT